MDAILYSSSIKSETGEDYFLVTYSKAVRGSSNLENEVIEIVLTDGNNTYRCLYKHDDKFPERIELWNKTKKDLMLESPENRSNRSFKFSVKPVPQDSVNFEWRVAYEDKFELNLLSTELKKENHSNSILGLLDKLSSTLMKDKKMMKDLIAENEQLKQNCEVGAKKLEEFAKLKSEHEKDLISKFIVLLNSKKAKIKELSGETSKQQNSEDSDGIYDQETSDEAEEVKYSNIEESHSSIQNKKAKIT